jgi:hypothetical protein
VNYEAGLKTVAIASEFQGLIHREMLSTSQIIIKVYILISIAAVAQSSEDKAVTVFVKD